MKRRSLIKKIGLTTGALSLAPIALAAKASEQKYVGSSFKIAHITDVHIRPEENAPERFKKCIAEIKKHKIDFILNGGDTIYAADYDTIDRQRMLDQWELWDDARKDLANYEVYSCLGNHDMWWAAPNKSDAMYGKDYVVKRLGIPKRYYSFDKNGWHFIILDSNNANAGSLDEEQRQWLENDLKMLEKATPIVIMSHYPILGVSTIIDGGNHKDTDYITKLFYQHNDKKIHCFSGHVHLLDTATYNDVHYYCNGAVSGFWWEKGNEHSAHKYWYHQTPPGYAILELKDDGSLTNTYHTY